MREKLAGRKGRCDEHDSAVTRKSRISVMASYKEVPCEVIHADNYAAGFDERAGKAGTSNSTREKRDKTADGDGALSAVAVAYSNANNDTKVRVVLDESQESKPNASPSWPRIDLRGREVILAISVFFLLSVCAGVGIILVKDRLNPTCTSQTAAGAAASSPSSAGVRNRPLCLSLECLAKAAEMIAAMNSSADPCEDFWQYSCGGWLAKNTIPTGRVGWSVDSEVVARIEKIVRQLVERPLPATNSGRDSAERKLKIVYNACMDVDAIEARGTQPLRDVLKKLGGSALEETWNARLWRFHEALGQIHFTYMTSVLFVAWVAPDDKEANKNVIQFDQAGLGMEDASYYAIHASDKAVSGYKEFMRTCLKLIYPKLTRARLDMVVRITFEFEQRLAKIYEPEGSETRRDPEAMYHNITIHELQAMCNKINWLRVLRILHPGVDNSTVVLITSRAYMRSLSEIIATTNKTVLNYYMIWRVIQRFVPDLSTPFRQAEHRYEAAKTGNTRPLKRRKFCLDVVNQWMGTAIGSIFIPANFPGDSRKNVEQMIDSIKDSFDDALDSYEWMDNATKVNAKAKLDSMSYKIGYPSFITNTTEIDMFYRKFNVTESDNFFEMHLRHMECIKMEMYEDLKKPDKKKKDWDMNPHEVNAYYSPTTNQMVFPAGILQNPYYNEKIPMYVNYGGIGTTIGHELTHGFDDFGARYNKEGKLQKWWSNDSWTQFKKRTQCVSELYSQHTIKGIKVNGKLTLGENIADIGGVLQAYSAFKKTEAKLGVGEKMPGMNLTNEQTFFLSYGQNWCSKRRPESMRDYLLMNMHAPAKIRAQVTLSQVAQFSRAFSCPVGSAMNPPSRCVVW